MASADRYFPLRAAGFVGNPFRALTDADWADVAVVAPALADLFEQSSAHLQVLGPLGAGKTSTLLGLQRRAVAAGRRACYVYLAEGQDALPPGLVGRLATGAHRATVRPPSAGDADALPPAAGDADAPLPDLLLLDEAQRLADAGWDRLLAALGSSVRSPIRSPIRSRPAPGGRAPRLIVAAHADQAARFAAVGAALATVRLDHLRPAEYRAILDRRLAAAALPNRPHATLTDDAVTFLQETYGANRRAAEWLLYEVFQRLRGPEEIDAARLQAAVRSADIPAIPQERRPG